MLITFTVPKINPPKARVQAKGDMGGEIGLEVLELEGNDEFRLFGDHGERISQIQADLEGIFVGGDLSRADAVSE